MSDLELGRQQKKARGRYILMLVCTGIVVVLSFVLFIHMAYHETEWNMVERIAVAVIGPCVLALGSLSVFYWLFVRKAYERFNLNFKNKYVLATIQAEGLFEQLRYQPHSGLSFHDIRNAAVVSCGQERYFHSEDLLTGLYRGIPFQYCDVETKHLVRRGRKSEIETIFEGQVMHFASFDEMKSSHGHLQIFQKELLSDIKGWTAAHQIQTEHAAFNKRFQVFAADEHNAFYILTPQLLEKIMEFADAVGEQIAITFRGPAMYVAIHRSRSMFNGYVDVPLDRQKQDILNDVRLLCKAGDILELEAAWLRHGESR